MSYEIQFSGFSRLEEGGYSKEPTTFNKKVGNGADDVPLDKVAGIIMGQLARRDVFIDKVEVFEISKKQITFKETKGGIIIKNKKFLTDRDANLIVQDVVEEPVSNTQLAKTNVVHPHNIQKSDKPIKWVLFMPSHKQDIIDLINIGVHLTAEKKYPVYAITPNISNNKAGGLMGEVYTLIDDKKKEVRVSDVNFVPAQTSLIGGDFNRPKESDGLSWGGTIDDNMPNIRGR